MITPRGTPTPIPTLADGLRPGGGVADGGLAVEVVEGREVVVLDAEEIGVVVVDSVTAAGGVVEIAFETDESDATAVLDATLDGSSMGVLYIV